jgi:exodeoxyribonuclease III
MKIVTWNVNGIRSVFKTTFRDWLAATNPDIACIQEIKADSAELTAEFSQIDGYYAYFNSGKRKGHSGVAVYTKLKPQKVESVLGIERFDDEGRCLKLTFDDFILFNFYIPNGGRDKENMEYKLNVYKQLFPQFAALKDQQVILAGDFNIAHTERDLFYPKQNKNNTMFTPEERQQITTLLETGYTDTLRAKYPDKQLFTWWPYMGDLRERDVGWRIDYIFVSNPLAPLIDDVFNQREIHGSDHGPYGVILNKKIEIGEPPIYIHQEPQPSLF